ncbi:MFS transporter [Actinomadura namibiensis]|uniref:MFS transporter n=1 Tax=Actinomadura kijaniata TaxID=46161 RepID=UPI00361991AF
MSTQDHALGTPAAYRRVLADRDFRLLWAGSTVSLAGDGMTFVALAWLVLSQPGGTARLGLLTVCFTLPVFAGGLLVGPLLDRFDKRHVLAADCVLRGGAVASIPLAAASGEAPAWLPFAVAAVHGLLKMVPLAGFPAAIPDLVRRADLDAANALEALGFGTAGVVGPSLGGLLIAGVGAPNVLAIDAASYLVFAVAALAVRRPLTPGPRADAATTPAARLSVLLRDRFLVVTTLAFMAFNVAEGMLLVVAPWLAKTHLPGGSSALGLLLAALAAGELAGAVAGLWRPRLNPLRALAFAQLAAGGGFLAVLLTPHPWGVAAGFLAIGLFSAPMTVWAQSLRMERIPGPLRGRAFRALRTLMQATPPLGAALATPILREGDLALAAASMFLVATVPVLMLLAPGSSRPPG